MTGSGEKGHFVHIMIFQNEHLEYYEAEKLYFTYFCFLLQVDLRPLLYLYPKSEQSQAIQIAQLLVHSWPPLSDIFFHRKPMNEFE